MKIIISPAKQMVYEDSIAYEGLPEYIDNAREILSYMKEQSYDQLKSLWKCSDKIANEQYRLLNKVDLNSKLSPAILSYDGIAFKYMAPSVFDNDEFRYVQNSLRILSALYGVVKPLDGIIRYRLEMQAKAQIKGFKNLYDYWGRKIYDSVIDESRIIINLASKEYSKCVEKYLTDEDKFITCVFAEMESGKAVQKGVYAKMARGEMVRYMAVNNVTEPEQIKSFNLLGYMFNEQMSDDNTYVFIKE